MPGLGVPRKYSTALLHFQLAGHQGHTRALFNLAQMHLNGLGTIRSCMIGVKLVRGDEAGEACDMCFGWSCHRIWSCRCDLHIHACTCAYAHVSHAHVSQMKTVAERGSWSQVLGDAHRSFLRGDYETSFILYARAAEEGHEVAQANAAWMADQSMGVTAQQQHRVANRYFQQAAEQVR